METLYAVEPVEPPETTLKARGVEVASI